MTVIVGVKCKDGVVIGADGIATSVAGQTHIIAQPTVKIDIINENVIVAGTGSVGLGQRFIHVVEQAWEKGLFKKEPVKAVTQLARDALINFDQTVVRQPNIPFGALVAFPCKQQPHLCEFECNTFQPELKTDDRIWVVSMGSGQPIADPFMFLMRSVFWEDSLPTHQEAVFGVTWTLMHTIACNPGGIGEPIQIAVLSNNNGSLKARLLTKDELEEHRQNIDGAKVHLRGYPKILMEASDAVPEPPAPPT